jgi:Uri superfamily endonuclease
MDVKSFSGLALPDNVYNSYQLYFRLESKADIRVGRFGRYIFLPGSYVYTGSAIRNLKTRVIRHISTQKKLHWHIDYLLSARGIRLSKIVLSGMDECELNRRTRGVIAVPGFGATDCVAGCGSHLKLIDELKNCSVKRDRRQKPFG